MRYVPYKLSILLPALNTPKTIPQSAEK